MADEEERTKREWNEAHERGEREQNRINRSQSEGRFEGRKDKPNYRVVAGGGRDKISHLKFFAGIIVWLIMSYIGTTYFPEGLWDFFGISGFAFMILIIYSDKWYPRFRRWRRGY